jgi:mono/diheme cytochrome c family protein
MQLMRNFLLGIISTIAVLFVGGYFYVTRGYVDLRADQEPSSTERHFAMAAMDASADRHASDAKNPAPATVENLVAGATLYLNHCGGCHGIPSNPDSQFARSFYPPAPGFFREAPDMPENENYYIVVHGIRWTGMPAWGKTLNDKQTWEIVTFLSNIEKLPPDAKRVLETSASPGGTSAK